MSTARRSGAQHPEPAGLPTRWAVIAILTAAAAVVGFLCGGPVAAITTGATVAAAAHKLLA